jgi:hypothetical protein
MFLTASEERISQCPESRFTHAWIGVMLFSLVWSLIAGGIWAGGWKLFGEPMGRVIPAGALAGVFVLWVFRRAVSGAMEILFRSDLTARSIATSVFVLVLTLGLLSIKRDFRHDSYLPDFIVWIRPWEKVYRPIVLMPLWGAWSMLVTVQFCRPRTSTSPPATAFAEGCTPLPVAAIMGLLLSLTITYFSFLGWVLLVIPGVTIVAAIAGGMIFCHLTNGPTRSALLATNIVTQMVFLLGCLSLCNLIFW